MTRLADLFLRLQDEELTSAEHTELLGLLNTVDGRREFVACAQFASAARQALYRGLLSLRQRHVTPHLEGARALKSESIGPAAIIARWELDKSVLTIVCNLGEALASAASPEGELLFESSEGALDELIGGTLRGATTVVTFDTPTKALAR